MIMLNLRHLGGHYSGIIIYWMYTLWLHRCFEKSEERNTVGSVVFHIVLLNFSKGCYKIHIFFRQILEDDPKQYLSIKSPNNDNSFLRSLIIIN